MQHLKLSIEGYPFIIRFKTDNDVLFENEFKITGGIEGYPFIIRFKTLHHLNLHFSNIWGIEGYPFIIRFKTVLAFS